MKKTKSNILLNYFYDYRLRNKLIISHISVIIIPIIILGITAFFITANYIDKAEKENHLYGVKAINNVIDFNYELYMRKSDTLFYSTNLQEILSKRYYDAFERQVAHRKIDEIVFSIVSEFNSALLNYSRINSKIGITFYVTNNTIHSNGETVRLFGEIGNEDWVKDIIKNNTLLWDFGYNDDSGKYDTITLSRKLVDFNSHKLLGILQIKIPIKVIEDLIKRYSDKSRDEIFLYVNKEGNVNVQLGGLPNKEDIQNIINDYIGKKNLYKFRYGSKDYLFTEDMSKMTGWKLISIVPLRYVKEGAEKIKFATISTIVLAVLICILVAIVVSNLLASRLKKFMNKIKYVEKDNYTQLVPIGGSDEIGMLDKVFDNMVLKIKDLIETEYKSRLLREQTKLELLQEQINPHLLYNTLSVIGWQAKQSGDTRIFDITNSLIRFYRTSLNRGDILIKLDQEIQMALGYIDIMEYTYRLDFDKVIDIDQEIGNYYSIKLILQPIIENAIMHGIRNQKGRGKLTVSGRLENGIITFVISDNGPGMDTEIIDNLLSYTDSNEKGYGLSNVIKRIRMYFVEKQDIIIKSSEEGTTVIINIEAMSSEDIERYLSKKFLI